MRFLITFSCVVSRNALDHVVRRYLQSVFRLSVIEILFVVKYFLNCAPDIVVQLFNQELLLLVFLDPLRNEFVGSVDNILVQLKLLFFPLKRNLLIVDFDGVKVEQGIPLFQKFELLYELVFFVTNFVLNLLGLVDAVEEHLASFSQKFLTFQNTGFFLPNDLYSPLFLLCNLLPHCRFLQLFLFNLHKKEMIVLPAPEVNPASLANPCSPGDRRQLFLTLRGSDALEVRFPKC